MTNLHFTAEELEIVRHAMTMINDMETDTALDNTDPSLYTTTTTPNGERIIRDLVVDFHKLTSFREQLHAIIDRQKAIASIMVKLDIQPKQWSGNE